MAKTEERIDNKTLCRVVWLEYCGSEAKTKSMTAGWRAQVQVTTYSTAWWHWRCHATLFFIIVELTTIHGCLMSRSIRQP